MSKKPKIIGHVQLGLHGDKGGHYYELQDFIKEEELTVTPEMRKNMEDFGYVLYEVLAQVAIYEDGTYEVSELTIGDEVFKKVKE